MRLDPYAVTFRYDDMDIELITREDAAEWVGDIREWAEMQVRTVLETEAEYGTDNG